MSSISLLVLDFILAVLSVLCDGWTAVTRGTVVVTFGNIFAVILALLLFLQVFKVLPTCG